VHHTATLSSATLAAHPAKVAIEAAHPPSDEATDHAAPKSAAADAIPATAQDHHCAKTIATAEAEEAEGEDVAMTVDEVATTGEQEAETSAQTFATALRNHQKAHGATLPLQIVVLEPLLPVLAPPQSTPSRRKKRAHPMWR
jgi:hypothetical protein